MNITIVIPTYKDRTIYLNRALFFYNQLNFKGQIIIGDSSEWSILKQNKALCDKYKNINILHIHYPLESYPHDGWVVNDICKYIDTDFACFSGDDDFHLPSTIEHCINFLNYNQDYIGAHGSKVKYNLDRGKIHNVKIVKGQYLDVDDPIFRFRGYMKTCTSPQYHVMRKEVFKEIYSHIHGLPNNKFLVAEVLPCSLYYISGKVKRFDDRVQYFMEQTDDAYSSQTPDYVIRGMNTKGWGECCSKIKDIIVNKLIKKGANKEASERAFDEEFNLRILEHFHTQFHLLYEKSYIEFAKKYLEFSESHDKIDNLKNETLNEAMKQIFPALAEYLHNKY